MNINKPIFIIGAGRYGITVFYNHLAIHPELAWFSNISDRFYKSGLAPYLHRLLDVPILGKRLKNKILAKKRLAVRPSEAGNIYHRMADFAHSKKMTRDDRTSVNDKLFKEQIVHHLSATGKERFVSKQTANTQRLELLSEMFEDAFFIHVIRDGRAVANSLYNVDFWKNIDLWWQSDSENSDSDSIELCARHWKNNINEILENRSLLGDRYLEIKYEDLGEDFMKEMERVIDFCDLRRDETFFDVLPKCLSNRNFKWKENLSTKQKEGLETLLEDNLKNLGYL